MKALGLLIATLALLCSVPAHAAAPDPRNPGLAASYNRISTVYLGEAGRDVPKALEALAVLRKKDPGNALNFYLAAAGLAFEHTWDKAAAMLEAGNKAPYCVHYHRGVGPNNHTPGFSTFRQFARECRDQAPVMDATQAAAILRGVRTMAAKVATTEPRQPLNLVIAVSLRAIVNPALVSVTPAGTPAAEAATRQLAADRDYGQAMGEEVIATFGDLAGTAAMLASAAKYGLTAEHLTADDRGEPLPAAVKAKLVKLARAMEAKERPFLEKWLKTFPE
jgi:hypothetical protein